MEKAKSTKREKYIDQFTNKLKKWDKDLEEFEYKINRKVDTLKNKYKIKIEDLKESRRHLEEKLDRLEDSSEKAFEPIKKDFEQLWSDMKNGLETVKNESKSSEEVIES